jgi:hypothetical protein
LERDWKRLRKIRMSRLSRSPKRSRLLRLLRRDAVVAVEARGWIEDRLLYPLHHVGLDFCTFHAITAFVQGVKKCSP